MKRVFTIEVCDVCYEQASRAYTGDPHLTCEHSSLWPKDEPIKTLTVSFELAPGVWRGLMNGETPTIKIDMRDDPFRTPVELS